MMTEELYINNECVDMTPDTRLTLNFKSNLLGDISKITASNSQTIRLPKTAKNRRILNNPSAVAHHSAQRYKRYRASYVRNGIEVVKIAYAVLLSSSDCYEIAIYWGVMAQFQAWIDKGAKLNDLIGTESIVWDQASATSLGVMKARGYGYAAYDCGVVNKNLVNIHPSATAWWILSKISEQAGFTIEMPEVYKEALRMIAIPCLSTNASPESWEAETSYTTTWCRPIKESVYMPQENPTPFLTYMVGYINAQTSTQSRPIYIGNNVAYTYCLSHKFDGIWYIPAGSKTVYMAEFSTLGLAEMDVRIDALSVNIGRLTAINMYVKKQGGSYAPHKSWQLMSGIEIRETVDCSSFDKYYFILSNPVPETAAYEVNIRITPHQGEMTYPSAFRITSNLPEITQVDFIKAICGMLGIFAVADPKSLSNIKFVSIDVLDANKANAVDWSDKLVKSNEDEPKGVEFKINDFCRNNLFKYKEDDTVDALGDGNLKINSEVLPKEKIVITLPFAASDGSKIPHYKLNNNETKAERVQIKDRIMRIYGDSAGRAALTFTGLDFNSLLSANYSVLSRMLNGAIATTERIALNESDLKSLNYTIPFYLRQYGKYYGLISVQTSETACEVKALQLPDALRPAREVVRIGYAMEGSTIYLTATKPTHIDITVTYEVYIDSDTDVRKHILPKGSTKLSLMIATRQFRGIKLLSLSPPNDALYNYVIAKQ